MYKALFLSPMVPSYDTKASCAFLEAALGFTTQHYGDGYAICSRDGLTIHFLPAGTDIGQMENYLEVDSVDAVWELLEDHVEGLRHKPPFDQSYGMREIHLEIPHTKMLLFIGQSIE